jgi:hypothetical protein
MSAAETISALDRRFAETLRRWAPVARARLHGDVEAAEKAERTARAGDLAESLAWNQDGGGPSWDEGWEYRSWALDNGLDPEADETFDVWTWGPYLDHHPERPETGRTAIGKGVGS